MKDTYEIRCVHFVGDDAAESHRLPECSQSNAIGVYRFVQRPDGGQEQEHIADFASQQLARSSLVEDGLVVR